MDKKNVVITQFFINLYDTNHNRMVTNTDAVELTHILQESVARFGVELHTLINFTNTGKVPPLQKIVNVDLNNKYPEGKIYFLRWVVTLEYLLRHPEIEKAAIVDAGDVEMMNYPFDDLDPHTLYVGDENNDLTVPIITQDGLPDYMRNFLDHNRYLQLLNTGILIGTRKVLLEYLTIFVKLVTQDVMDSKLHPGLLGLGDWEMAIANYILYKLFPSRIYHGRQVATLFQHTQRETESWFKHK
ncbi:hypothetical protein PT287_09890 [Lactobacillus sp. ESL0679]|uniref:hypothetical protein n=1 Tax=Lactobacillus sp. ESL0679 TaxID=2983209 RepID=UPI0023F852CD|nr:hypothetical protein [Lactobacillus sp. ESL0679]MDF7683809.1 hypothetical protein [Lactobacillus sp. ESL0679]